MNRSYRTDQEMYSSSSAGEINANTTSIGQVFSVRGTSLPDLTRSVVKQDIYPAAHGGFADIWVCDWADPGFRLGTRKVAVKVIRSVNSGIDDKRKLDKRLRRELAVWLVLRHPRVLPLYGVVSDFGPYVSMVCPWMDNGNLSGYLCGAGQSLSIEARYTILQQVCSGLEYLHSCSVVHGDLTGCNVLIDAAGNACLSDFGLSTIISDMQGASTFTTSIGGNVRFSAPELYRVGGEDDVLPLPTAESDIYSFGSITLLTLTAKVPYHYMRTDGQVLIELARGHRPRRPSDGIITDSRWEFISACWANRPTDRPTILDIHEYLSDPLNLCLARRPPLPPLDDIRLVAMLNISHRRGLETWTALHDQETVVAKLVKVPLSDVEKVATIQKILNVGEVHHESISVYLGVSVLDNSIAVIMPWLDNRNLCSYLRGAFVPLARKFLLLQQIADALSYLHSLSIIHGGLTGWNILIDRASNAKLINYVLMPLVFQHAHPSKLATIYDEDFRWADPALWLPRDSDSPRPSISPASDVFSFGRVVLQMLTSHQPFQEEWEDIEAIEAAIETLTPNSFHPERPPRQMVSDDMWELVLSCWADEPGDRPTMNLVAPRVAGLIPQLSPNTISASQPLARTWHNVSSS